MKKSVQKTVIIFYSFYSCYVTKNNNCLIIICFGCCLRAKVKVYRLVQSEQTTSCTSIKNCYSMKAMMILMFHQPCYICQSPAFFSIDFNLTHIPAHKIYASFQASSIPFILYHFYTAFNTSAAWLVGILTSRCSV